MCVCVYRCVYVLATPLLLQLALAMPSEFISFPLHAHFVQFFCFAIKKSLQGNAQKNNKNARMNDRAKNGKKGRKCRREKKTRLVQEKGSKNDAHKMRSGSGILQLCALLCGVKMHGKLKRDRERTGCIRNRNRAAAAQAEKKRKKGKKKKRIAK